MTGTMPASHYSPSAYHQTELTRIMPRLAYDGGDVMAWQRRLRRKLKQLLGYRLPAQQSLDVRTLWQREHPLGVIEKLAYASEPGVMAPAYFCRPRDVAPPYPVMICLQGHTSGMHNSIGVAFEDETTPIAVEGDRDFALGCLSRGIAAFCIEQRGFGERKDPAGHGCVLPAMQALMIGKTIMGERVLDVARGIDYLATREDIDFARLGIMGNSGGGTTSMYAAALLPRIRYVMPSCSFCSFRASWMASYHCVCGYVPHLCEYAEMADVAGLIAPRPLLIVAGEHDHIQPIAGVREAFVEVQRIYRALGAEAHCQLVIGDGGHRFYADLAWPVMCSASFMGLQVHCGSQRGFSE